MLLIRAIIISAALALTTALPSSGFVSFDDVSFMHPDSPSTGRNDFAVDLETDGAGNWVAVTSGPYASRSSDNGETWTTPALVAPGYSIPGFWEMEPRVETDGAGSWIMVWSGDPDGLGTGTDSDIYLSRSTDNGATWSPGVAFASNAGTDSVNDGSPRLATDGAGNWMVVWHTFDTPNDDFDLLFTTSTDNGATWAPVAFVDPFYAFENQNDRFPALATDGVGNWVIVYNSNPGNLTGKLRIWRSNDFGATWTGPLQINTTLGLAVPDIASGGPGVFVAAHANTNFNIGRSTDGGVTWTSQPVSGVFTAAQSRARIATDGQGGWVGIWSSHDDPLGTLGEDADVLISRSADDGVRWSSPAVLNSDAGSDFDDDDWATVESDGAGTWLAAWQKDDGADDIWFARSEALCPLSRRNDCTESTLPGKGKMVLSDNLDDTKDKLKFKISKAGATDISDFGDPTTTGETVFCMWDASADVDRLIWQIPIAAGETCGVSPCWSGNTKGYRYLDKLSEEGAFQKAKLSAGEAGKASVSVGGKGLRLGSPPTPFNNDTSLAAGIISLETNACWSATFSAPKKNDFGKYVGKSD